MASNWPKRGPQISQKMVSNWPKKNFELARKFPQIGPKHARKLAQNRASNWPKKGLKLAPKNGLKLAPKMASNWPKHGLKLPQKWPHIGPQNWPKIFRPFDWIPARWHIIIINRPRFLKRFTNRDLLIIRKREIFAKKRSKLEEKIELIIKILQKR